MSEQSEAAKKRCYFCGQASVKPYLCGRCDGLAQHPASTPKNPIKTAEDQDGIAYAMYGTAGRAELHHKSGRLYKVYAIRVRATKVEEQTFAGLDCLGKATEWIHEGMQSDG